MNKQKPSDQEQPENELLEQLTDDQRTLLFQALEIVKQKVFSDVVKRFRNHLIVSFSLITLFGIISFVGFKTAIKDATVAALREDATLRQSIKEDAATKVTKADDLLDKIESIHVLAKESQISASLETEKELDRMLVDLKIRTQEENLLFERSARELNELVMDLKELRNNSEVLK